MGKYHVEGKKYAHAGIYIYYPPPLPVFTTETEEGSDRVLLFLIVIIGLDLPNVLRYRRQSF